jgi:hypothetical protein
MQTASSRNCGHQRGQQLDQLARVDRAAAQLGVDLHVLRDRRRRRQRMHELRHRVDCRVERVVVDPVAQRLDAAGGRAGADRHQELRRGAQLDDPRDVLGRADRALDEQHVVGTRRAAGLGLGKVDDVEALAEPEQFVLEVEQLQLAAVTGGELDDADARSDCGGGLHQQALS